MKTGTDHFPKFQASTMLDGVKYTGEVRGTKKLAARSCAESCLVKNTYLVLDHTDETIDQIVELSKSHKGLCVVTSDDTMLSCAEFEVQYAPPGVTRAMILQHVAYDAYHNIYTYVDSDIEIKTKNPEMIAFVDALVARSIAEYNEEKKKISIC